METHLILVQSIDSICVYRIQSKKLILLLQNYVSWRLACFIYFRICSLLIRQVDKYRRCVFFYRNFNGGQRSRSFLKILKDLSSTKRDKEQKERGWENCFLPTWTRLLNDVLWTFLFSWKEKQGNIIFIFSVLYDILRSALRREVLQKVLLHLYYCKFIHQASLLHHSIQFELFHHHLQSFSLLT